MRLALIILFALFHSGLHAQHPGAATSKNDTVIVVANDIAKGFNFDYILFIPKGVPLQKKTILLVEPNNTGKLSDDMEVHKQHAISLASVSSVGNNISTELKIPLLVPVFPRPASRPLVYTHALDRDVMLEKSPDIMRLDLQLLEMIKDARSVLLLMGIQVDDKIFMNGFSASGTFTNRFSFMHPGIIKALAIGGFNGKLMIPLKEINAVTLDYPVGINDFQKVLKGTFDLDTYKRIPQFIYLGKLDNNDAVQFEDAYSDSERTLINEHLGENVQERFIACQKIYQKENINATFRTFENVGHWTTAEVNLEVIKFFLSQMHE